MLIIVSRKSKTFVEKIYNKENKQIYFENSNGYWAKNEYNKKYHATRKRKKYRAELNAENRKKGTYGKMTAMGKDRSHTKTGKLVLESRSKNRARNNKGDNARLK